MNQASNRIEVERDRLQEEFLNETNQAKASQLRAAKQALDWVIDPSTAVAPSWMVLAGRA